jgi:hypothetical protein
MIAPFYFGHLRRPPRPEGRYAISHRSLARLMTRQWSAADYESAIRHVAIVQKTILRLQWS